MTYERSPISSFSDFRHFPVLAEEILRLIGEELSSEGLSEGILIDATLGGGGHSALLLQAFPSLRLIGLDQDSTARKAASESLSHFGDRVEILSTNFADFIPPEEALIVLADLGVSSPQLDIASRGFSFRLDGPLDMRMNLEGEMTAADLLENSTESELADIIYFYGEEKRSRRIARRIKQDLEKYGPYAGTQALAYAVAGCFPPKSRFGRIHPATRTFQALRIAVNDELVALEKLLSKAPDWLQPRGLVGIVSFHSLEDRRVKRAFSGDSRLEPITRKPISAGASEIALNPRSRSAKFRIAKKII